MKPRLHGQGHLPKTTAVRETKTKAEHDRNRNEGKREIKIKAEEDGHRNEERREKGKGSNSVKGKYIRDGNLEADGWCRGS